MNTLDIELYKVFAKKELVEGCYTIEKDGTMWHCGNGEWKKCWNQKGDWGLSSHYGEYMGEILGVEPRLEDVFQKAKEKNLFYGIEGHYEKNKNFEFIEYVYFSNIDIGEHYIEYNPCLPILLQTDETKTKLLNIFK